MLGRVVEWIVAGQVELRFEQVVAELPAALGL
jgi:hypothetical protein